MERVVELVFVEKVDENGVVYTEVEERYYDVEESEHGDENE